MLFTILAALDELGWVGDGLDVVENGWDGMGLPLLVTLQPAKDRAGAPEYHRSQLLHARSYINPLSGIPEGSIDSIDRGSLRADPLGLDQIDSIDRGSLSVNSSLLDPFDQITFKSCNVALRFLFFFAAYCGGGR